MYLKVDELKKYQIKAFEDKKPEELEALISLYSSMIDEYCNTCFKEAQHHFSVDVASKIPVMRTPLLRVQNVLYKQQPFVENEDYYVYEDRNLIELEDTSRLKQRKKAITIHYTYGFEQVPASVKKAIIELMKLHIEGSSANALISQESFDSEYSYTKNTQKTTEQLQQDILSSLDLYKQKKYVPIEDNDGEIRARLI